MEDSHPKYRPLSILIAESKLLREETRASCSALAETMAISKRSVDGLDSHLRKIGVDLPPEHGK
jgi:hypothetical protein